MNPLIDSSGAVYFNKIAYDLDNPLSIFTLGKEDAYFSCYYIFKGGMHAMNLGEIQSMTDGKIFVVANLPAGQIYIDSIRSDMQGNKSKDSMDVAMKILDIDFGDANLNYVGEETINNIPCKKIRANFSKSKDYVLYWVDAVKGNLVMMAENQHNSFNVYWIKEITKVPANYDFSVEVPDKEMQTLGGFTVFDMRKSDINRYKKIESIQ